MSKKMMKRSLALGALMAFVITGQAWAADEYGKLVSGNDVLDWNDKTISVEVVNTGSERAFGVRAESGATINLGGEATENITIIATAEGTSGNSYAVGLNGGPGGKVNVNSGNLTIVVNGGCVEDDGSKFAGYGIYASNGTTLAGDSDYSDNGTVIIGENVVTRVTVGEGGTGVTTQSMGVVEIKGDLYVTATKALSARDDSKLSINSAGNQNTIVQLDGDIAFNYASNSGTGLDSMVDVRLMNSDSYLNGKIYAGNVPSGVDGDVAGMSLTLANGATWTVTGDSFVNTLNGDGGIIAVEEVDGNLATVTVTTDGATNLTVQQANVTADNFATEEAQQTQLNALANVVKTDDGDAVADVVAIEAGDVIGEVTASVTKDEEGNIVVGKATEATHTGNQAIGEAAVALKSHWRAHMNDMNKRMGELRNANGEAGVWTCMVRGESEYEGVKAQYNQYQLGYDEKLSVDKRWTVGAAVTFSEGNSSFGKGSTEDDSTAFAIYGSKLNNDGTFVDLIARYAHLESDVTVGSATSDYGTNGYSVSAEFGKRIKQGNGLWIEPQVELTYGSVDSAEYVLDGKTVQAGDMDSLIGRIGFSLGKDIKQGNVYARASYLYDFDGETETTFSNATGITRTIKEDLGGGWWEVGVGANINLSKATYIYADIEKTFGGEVDTNWQWNLGVRYSF